MDTAQQALFRDMLNNGWFTESDGDVESPTGYFGYVVNAWGEYDEVRDNFSDTIAAYGDVAPMDFYGVYLARINSDGIIGIVRVGDYVRGNGAVLGINPNCPNVKLVKKLYELMVNSYSEWADS